MPASPSSTSSKDTPNLHSPKKRQRTQSEYDDLARDPAHNNNLTGKGIRERQIALDLERTSKLPYPIKRDPSGHADFIDGNGVSWDIKAFQSYFPGTETLIPRKKGGFDIKEKIRDIEEEFNKNQNVILDTTNLTSHHAQELRDEITRRGWNQRVVYYP